MQETSRIAEATRFLSWMTEEPPGDLLRFLVSPPCWTAGWGRADVRPHVGRSVLLQHRRPITGQFRLNGSIWASRAINRP